MCKPKMFFPCTPWCFPCPWAAIQKVSCRAAPHGSWGWVSHLEAGAEAPLGQPQEEPRQAVHSFPSLILIPTCPFAPQGLRRWVSDGLRAPVMGLEVARAADYLGYSTIVSLCYSMGVQTSVYHITQQSRFASLYIAHFLLLQNTRKTVALTYTQNEVSRSNCTGPLEKWGNISCFKTAHVIKLLCWIL